MYKWGNGRSNKLRHQVYSNPLDALILFGVCVNSFSAKVIQPKIDSIEIYKRYEHNVAEVIKIKEIDTIYFEDFRILKGSADINTLLKFVDTIHQVFLLRPEQERISQEGCNDNRSWITELTLKLPDYKIWEPKILKI